jgi:hypothetical protein
MSVLDYSFSSAAKTFSGFQRRSRLLDRTTGIKPSLALASNVRFPKGSSVSISAVPRSRLEVVFRFTRPNEPHLYIPRKPFYINNIYLRYRP